MRRALSLVLVAALAGCGTRSPNPELDTVRGRAEAADLRSVAIVPSPYEPAAQIGDGAKASYAEGAVVGAAGGAGVGAMSAKASAGLLCTVSGPLCLVIMIPAAIVGGLVGGVAGAAVDAIATDPLGRVKDARGAIEQAVADMRLTQAVAAKTHAGAPDTKLVGATEDWQALGAQGHTAALQVDVTNLSILAREKDMALALKARSRLYRTSDGKLLDERVSEAQTEFRKYQDWAADEAQPLKRAVDAAVANLSRSIVSEQLAGRPRADIAAHRGG